VYLHAGEEEAGCPERALAQRLGIDDRVRFLGSVDDVPALFAASDVFVMPSLYEGFPIAPLEALASGLPTVLTDVPGLRDFRGLGAGVVFVEPSVEAIVAALEHHLGRDRAQVRSEGAADAELARAQHGVEAGVARYLSVYAGAPADGDARS
jgi:glycosyltransferase involved in cell wall biosynthesis